MSRILGRPALVLPLGVVLLLVGLLMALSSIGAARWGGVVTDGTECGSGQEDMCLERTDASLDGPRFSLRSAGDRWEVTASEDTHTVSLPESDALDGAAEGALLTQPDGDVVGVEVDGERVGTTWVGTLGVLQLVGLGLVVLGLGAGMVVVGVRIRRATGSWTQAQSVQQHGSGLVAVPVVLGFLMWMAARFLS